MIQAHILPVNGYKRATRANRCIEIDGNNKLETLSQPYTMTMRSFGAPRHAQESMDLELQDGLGRSSIQDDPGCS